LPLPPPESAAGKNMTGPKIDKDREIALSPDGLKERIANLNQELDRTVRFYRRRGRSANWFSLLLVIAGLLASVLIAIGGILFDLSSKFLGTLALVPSVAMLVNSVIQPQARSDWNYAKKDRLNALRRELLYELSDPPCPEEVRRISGEWTLIDSEMNVAWHQSIAINWSALTRFRLSEDPRMESQRRQMPQITRKDEVVLSRK
jgi:hypothetical protein